MDGHRPDRYAVATPNSHPYAAARPPRRSSDASSPNNHPHTSPNQFPPRGFPGRSFDSPPRYPPSGRGGGGGPGGPGFRPMGGGGGRFPPSEYEVPISRHAAPPVPTQLSGQKREFPFRESPDHFDGGSFDRKNFDGGNFERKTFDRGSFEGKNAVGGVFDRNNFEGGNYEKRSFDGGSYDKNNLNGAHTEKRSFDGSSYDNNNLNGAHLEKKSFDGGSLEKKSFDGGSFAKLFVGSVPKTATEEVIRPLFEEHGNVVEVALIKDKRTGQQQGCCFIKYATSEEADRAIRGLHNQCTLPGGVGPIQVRYADGERERLGAVEYKLFVGSLNKQATEKEVEEIFIPYGRVEDVYLMRDEMKQSRGCGFVKFRSRDMAMAAINALNGIYTMPGCGQPLIVRFADPKRPRPGESRNVPASGGPGFDPQFQTPGLRPPPNLMEPMRGPVPSNAWNPMNPQNIGPSPGVGTHGFGSQMLPKSDDKTMPLPPGGTFGGPNDGSLPGHTAASSAQQNYRQSFNQPLPQVPYVGQQVSPSLKPNQSPQEFPSSLQPQIPASYSQAQASSTSIRPLGQPSFGQGYPSQQMLGFGGQVPVSQPQVQPGVSLATTQPPLTSNLPPHVLSAMASQHQLPGQQQQQQQLQPPLQSPSPLAQMLSQQTQTLQASYQSSQQAFSQLQQQLQLMQPSSQSLTGQQSVPASKQQSPWPGTAAETAAMPSTVKPVSDAIPATSAASVWTEHTSPDGYKYYYNSKTGESKWEKPEEMKLPEQPPQQQQLQEPPQQQLLRQPSQQQMQQQPSQQQMQQQPSQKQMQQQPSQQQLQQQPPQLQQQPHQQSALAQQPQNQTRTQGSAAQQFSQTSQLQLQNQLQAQLHHQQPLQHVAQSSSARGAPGHQNIQEYVYSQLPVAANSVSDPARYQQGPQAAAHEWMWKNKPSG